MPELICTEHWAAAGIKPKLHKFKTERRTVLFTLSFFVMVPIGFVFKIRSITKTKSPSAMRDFL